MILVELIAIKLSSDTDPSLGAVVAMWLFGGFAGLLVGALLAARCLDRQPALAETLAPLLYALTALAAPFLLYVTMAMVAISALSGMTF